MNSLDFSLYKLLKDSTINNNIRGGSTVAAEAAAQVATETAAAATVATALAEAAKATAAAEKVAAEKAATAAAAALEEKAAPAAAVVEEAAASFTASAEAVVKEIKDYSTITSEEFVGKLGRLIIILLVTIGIGATFMYNFLNSRKHWSVDEDLTFIDCVYFHFTTLSTVGYGDICPITQESRIYTIFLIIIIMSEVLSLGGFFV